MTIVCPSCETKFNLDDSKIKGKSVKLKCSKCGNVFSTGDKPQPIKKPQFEPETHSPPDPDKGSEMDENLKAAIDDALKGFQTGKTESDDLFGNTPVDKDANMEAPSGGEHSFSVRDEAPKKEEEFISAGFDFETKTDPTKFSGDTENQEQVNAGGSAGDLIGDLEFELGREKTSEAKRAEEKLPEVNVEDFDIGEGIKSSPSPFAAPAAPRPFPSTPPPAPMPKSKSVPVARAPAHSKSVFPYIFFFLFIIAGAGAGYIYRSDLLSLFNQKPALNEKSVNFTVSDTGYHFLQNIRGQTLFIVEGKATNKSIKPQGFLKLNVMLKDISGNEIARKEFYAGNIFSDDILRTAPAVEIDERLSNRVGDSLSNINIPSPGSIPFMAVFYDIPNVSTFTVEVVSSEEIH